MLELSSTVSAQPQTNSLLPVSVYCQFTAPLIYSTLVHSVSCLENNLRSSLGKTILLLFSRKTDRHHQQAADTTFLVCWYLWTCADGWRGKEKPTSQVVQPQWPFLQYLMLKACNSCNTFKVLLNYLYFSKSVILTALLRGESYFNDKRTSVL